MSRFIGSFMDDNELDRPDLNKCPDCECFFPQDTCPICGKVCPEEMRAGNRKKQKKKKERNGRSKTVEFIDWYHRWWFIILMLFIFPIIGIILLASSPHKKGVKIAIIAVAVLYSVGSWFGFGSIVNSVKNTFEKPVDSSLSYEEYTQKCTVISPEEYYRNPEKYTKQFVGMTLEIQGFFYYPEGGYTNRKYNDYIVCEYSENGTDFIILIRDCRGGGKNLVKGDKIRVFGEGAGNVNVTDQEYNSRSGPCINAAYIDLVE